MADGRTARPGHVTPERALRLLRPFHRESPPTRRPLPSRARPSRSFPRSLSRSSGALRGPLKGTGSGAPEKGRAATIENKERWFWAAARETPASLGPAHPRFLGVPLSSTAAAGPSGQPRRVWFGHLPAVATASAATAPVACVGRWPRVCPAWSAPPPVVPACSG